jgi:hypothetical protein
LHKKSSSKEELNSIVYTLRESLNQRKSPVIIKPKSDI